MPPIYSIELLKMLLLVKSSSFQIILETLILHFMHVTVVSFQKFLLTLGHSERII